MIKVTQLKPLRGYRLHATFSDGTAGEHDFSTPVAESGPMVEPLRDPASLGEDSRSRRDSRICSVSLPSASPSRSPPSFAVRCGGDFNTFVSSISAAAAAGTSQSVISQTLGQGIS
jgi:hypothetical protein